MQIKEFLKKTNIHPKNNCHIKPKRLSDLIVQLFCLFRRCSSRQSLGETAAWTYPDNKCNICGSSRVQYGGRKVQHVKITSFQAQETIKAAARVKDMDMYNEIQDLDLIAND